MWVTSRLIRRDGKLPGGSPQRVSLWIRLEGLGFLMVEYILCAFGAEVGEELVLEVKKA